MYCLKCGRDTKADKVFCEECLESMRHHPVKPGTAIQIPSRSAKVAPKKAAKRPPTPEEQIVSLKRVRFWLCLVIVVLSVCLCGMMLYAHMLLKPPAVTEVTTESTTQTPTETTAETTAEPTTGGTTEPEETGNVSRETSGR